MSETMLTIKLVNDGTGTDDEANYRFSVRVNFKEIASGRVCGHNRKDPWWVLLSELVIQQMTLKAEKNKQQ